MFGVNCTILQSWVCGLLAVLPGLDILLILFMFIWYILSVKASLKAKRFIQFSGAQAKLKTKYERERKKKHFSQHHISL